MDNILLHKSVKTSLQQYLNAPAQAILLVAPEASGKATIAETLANELLGGKANEAKNPAIIYIEKADKSISIDAVRILQKQLQLKTIGSNPVRRVVIIRDAHLMTDEAQNALLKILEEPPRDTVFILTAIPHSVLPTIYSRTQHFIINEPSVPEIIDYFSKQKYISEDIDKAIHYGGKRVGLIATLLKKGEEHETFSKVIDAKKLLSSTLFERLCQVDVWQKDKHELISRFDSLERLCQFGVRQAAKKNNLELANRWQCYYQAIYESKSSLAYTPNTKLLLTNLFLRLT
jgi:hypothetical protein